MSCYVMSDIHGCYEDFLSMLSKIQFDFDEDTLYLLGDYIDRGPQSDKMVEWLMDNRCNNIVVLRGNHEEEFISCIEILESIDSEKSLLEICDILHNKSMYFDTYGTIRQLIKDKGFSIDQLVEWKNYFKSLEYTAIVKIRGQRPCILTHAGYAKDIGDTDFDSVENLYLYARDVDTYKYGGTSFRTIIAGHTPTIIDTEMQYNHGEIFFYRDKISKIRYVDIDCGCAFKPQCSEAHLACLRLDDGEQFYI